MFEILLNETSLLSCTSQISLSGYYHLFDILVKESDSTLFYGQIIWYGQPELQNIKLIR